ADQRRRPEAVLLNGLDHVARVRERPRLARRETEPAQLDPRQPARARPGFRLLIPHPAVTDALVHERELRPLAGNLRVDRHAAGLGSDALPPLGPDAVEQLA